MEALAHKDLKVKEEDTGEEVEVAVKEEGHRWFLTRPCPFPSDVSEGSWTRSEAESDQRTVHTCCVTTVRRVGPSRTSSRTVYMMVYFLALISKPEMLLVNLW